MFGIAGGEEDRMKVMEATLLPVLKGFTNLEGVHKSKRRRIRRNRPSTRDGLSASFPLASAVVTFVM